MQRPAQFAGRPLRPDLDIAVAKNDIRLAAHEQQALARRALDEVFLDEGAHARLGQRTRQAIDRRVHGRIGQEGEKRWRVVKRRQSRRIGRTPEMRDLSHRRPDRPDPACRYVNACNRNAVGHTPY